MIVHTHFSHHCAAWCYWYRLSRIMIWCIVDQQAKAALHTTPHPPLHFTPHPHLHFTPHPPLHFTPHHTTPRHTTSLHTTPHHTTPHHTTSPHITPHLTTPQRHTTSHHTTNRLMLQLAGYQRLKECQRPAGLLLIRKGK
jgi:hypothetical protein